MLQCSLKRINASEWSPPGQHLIQHHSQGVDIAASVATFSLQLLGGYVLGCTYYLREVCKRDPPRTDLRSSAETDQLDMVAGIDHDILRFDITVNDPTTLYVLKCLADAYCNPYGAL